MALRRGRRDDAPTATPVDVGLPAEPTRRRSSGGTPLGDLMIQDGLITPEALAEALASQEVSGDPLGLILLRSGYLTDTDLTRILARQQNLFEIDLRHVTPTAEALALVPEPLARAHGILPLSVENGVLACATADPRPGMADDLAVVVGVPLVISVADRSDIERLLATHYDALTGIAAQIDTYLGGRTVADQVDDMIGAHTDDAPVVKVVDMILSQAVRDRASDVHMESRDTSFLVRFRVDGALRDVARLPASMAGPIAGRIKVMAGMNIVERRRPQDGQVVSSVDGRDLDIRVSTVGTVWGEKIVLRLLDRGKPAMHLSQLGMSEHAYKRFSSSIATPFGMVVCAGPTGAGKTTTLYASLREIDSVERSITTIEDPVEYMFPGITQISINELAGVTFATGLRAILRQDPDVILVGEIRDYETARIAIQAALTGHLVFSSLHATDSVSALYRFIDMGVEPFLVASSVRAIVGQRLVRRLCTGCARDHRLTPEEKAFWARIDGPPKVTFRTSEGCNRCSGTGYLERVGAYEVLEVDDVIAERLVTDRPSAEVMRTLAIERGLVTLRDESVRLVSEGVTSVLEVMRAVHTI